MNRKLAAVGIGALALVFCLSSLALAENKAGKFSLSPMIGGYIFEGNQDQKNSWAYTLAVGYNFTKSLGTEVAFSFVDTEADPAGPGPKDIDVSLARWDVLYHFAPDSALVPYVAAGVGTLITNPNVGKTDPDLMLNYGAGVKYFFAENVALRGDVRHVWEVDDKYNNLIYSAGLVFQLASTGAPAPIQADPVVADSDGDGVPDDRDKCPDTPRGVQVDADGCPLQMTLDIEFDFNKATIRPMYHDDLARAARFIEDNPSVPTILIAGHTDSVGKDAYNQRLSEQRAESVRRYLIEHFDIDGQKLVSRGYGETQPRATNETEEGRQRNRRVEVICYSVLPD